MSQVVIKPVVEISLRVEFDEFSVAVITVVIVNFVTINEDVVIDLNKASHTF